MLTEKHLALASLFLAISGFALLFFINNAIEPQEISIGDIGKEHTGEMVSVLGRVDWVLEKDGFIIFTLNDGAKIKAIRFSPTKEESNAAKVNSFVRVTGKVQIYEGEVEIVAFGITQ